MRVFCILLAFLSANHTFGTEMHSQVKEAKSVVDSLSLKLLQTLKDLQYTYEITRQKISDTLNKLEITKKVQTLLGQLSNERFPAVACKHRYVVPEFTYKQNIVVWSQSALPAHFTVNVQGSFICLPTSNSLLEEMKGGKQGGRDRRREGGREGERKEDREGEREGEREGGKEERREGEREERRQGGREGERERGREGGREGGREERREGGRKEDRVGKREGGRDGRREGGKEERREGKRKKTGRERGKERGRERGRERRKGGREAERERGKIRVLNFCQESLKNSLHRACLPGTKNEYKGDREANQNLARPRNKYIQPNMFQQTDPA